MAVKLNDYRCKCKLILVTGVVKKLIKQWVLQGGEFDVPHGLLFVAKAGIYVSGKGVFYKKLNGRYDEVGKETFQNGVSRS